MKDYNYIKTKHPDAIALVKVGSFYETYEEDAKITAEVLELTLVRRGTKLMAGFPTHALDNYLPKLVRAGKRVAICEGINKENKKVWRQLSLFKE